MSTDLELHTNLHRPGALIPSSNNLNIQAPSYRIIIKDPQTLATLATHLSSSPQSTITLTTEKGSEHPLPIPCIKALKIAILAPIRAETALTPTELNGGTNGPVTSSLTQAWRDAFRRIPAQHCIERVEFDMSCERRLKVRHIGKLLQEVSTVLYLKTKMRMGREVWFEAMGCESRAKKMWLEGCFPENRERGGALDVWGQGKGRMGGRWRSGCLVSVGGEGEFC